MSEKLPFPIRQKCTQIFETKPQGNILLRKNGLAMKVVKKGTIFMAFCSPEFFAVSKSKKCFY